MTRKRTPEEVMAAARQEALDELQPVEPDEKPPFDPGPCPLCGGTGYVVNWLSYDGGDGLTKFMPGSVTCTSERCPSHPQPVYHPNA